VTGSENRKVQIRVISKGGEKRSDLHKFVSGGRTGKEEKRGDLERGRGGCKSAETRTAIKKGKN